MKLTDEALRDRNYLLDRDGNILKIVGDDHDDFVVSYVKYHPNGAGTKHFLGRTYAVNTDVCNSFYILASAPNKLRYSYKHGNCVTGCLRDDIVRVFDAREKLDTILAHRDQWRTRSKPAQSLVHALSYLEAQGIDLTKLGITGSFLTEMDGPQSDIDLVSYGRKTAAEIAEIVNRSRKFEKYTGKHFPALLARRRVHMPAVSPEALRVQERRKIQGLYDGVHFNVQPLRENITKSDSSYVDMGEMTIIAKVLDDKESIYAPAYYSVGNVEILEGYKSNEVEKRLNKVISFVGAYSQIIKRGERVYAKGTLLREENGGIRYAISIDPWNRGRDNKLQLVR